MKYTVLRTLPVAKFFYKGTHTHPVRRTVLVIETNGKMITGYELREGNEVRQLNKAPVKSYKRNKIAITSQLRTDNPLRKKKPSSTLRREGLIDLLENGI